MVWSPCTLILSVLFQSEKDTEDQCGRHVCRGSDWINRITKLHVEGSMPRGRPRKTWLETVFKDKKLREMENADPTDRDACRQAQAKRRNQTRWLKWNNDVKPDGKARQFGPF